MDPKITGLQQELDLYKQGARKINGTWLSAANYQNLIAEQNRRQAAIAESRRQAEQAETQRQILLAEEKRKAETEAKYRPAPTNPAITPIPLNGNPITAAPVIFPNKQLPEPPQVSFKAIFGLVIVIPLIFLGLILLKILFMGLTLYRKKQNLPPLPSSFPPPLPVASKNSLESLEWDQFEVLVGEIYRRKGYSVEISGGDGADGGIDLKLTKDEETSIVQCKHWKTYKVGVKEIREFFGVMASDRINQGYFVTTGEFTQDAWAFAENKPIALIGRADVNRAILEVSRPGENLLDSSTWMDGFVAAAKITDPDCPYCHQQMVLRTKRTGGQFWGCSSFPKNGCKGMRNARADLLRHRAYQPR